MIIYKNITLYYLFIYYFALLHIYLKLFTSFFKYTYIHLYTNYNHMEFTFLNIE